MDRPNVLLITTDQQRFDTINALGNKHIYTPHLNWLADEGIVFERCYSDSPICMPARATIMTGKHGYSHGLIGNQTGLRPMNAETTLPGVLTRNGYQTRAQGKMHFDPIRANYGFEHMELPLDYYRHLAEHGLGIAKGHGVAENEMEPVISTVHETRSATYWTTKRSIDFLETRDETRPFFLWSSFTKPHPPFDPCYNYWALYQNKEMPPPIYGDWSDNMEEALHGFYQPTYLLNNFHRMSAEQIQDTKRAYYASITQVDYSLGLLFARMREMELLDNTWIIFTSDHGELLGDHHMGAKTVFLEGSAHIPMLIRPPKARELSLYGKRCDSLVTLADVMPTILSVTGISESVEMDGINLLALTEEKSPDRTFYGICNDYCAIMEEGYKYIWTAFGGQELLFNMKNDPMEQKNLANTEKETAQKMKKKLYEHVLAHQPELCENGALKEKKAITGSNDVDKWPGFHSTYFPSDVLH